MTVPWRVKVRALAKVAYEGDCIVSTYSTGSHGYCQVGWQEDGGNRRMTLVHRVAWETFVGPIPDGMTIDHICRNRRCCNPDHLRLLTNQENASDNGNNRKTHCPAGHPYDEANTYRNPKGRRFCRTCARLRRVAA